MPSRLKLAPLHSGRDHQGVAGDFVSVRQLDDSVRAFRADANRFLRRQNFHSKTLGLHHRAPRQIVAAEPRWKSQIILDARTHSRLAAGRFPLDHHRVQSLGRAINRSRQARRPSAHDGQIIKIGLRPGPQSHLLGDIRRKALQKLGSVGKQHNRKIRRLRPQRLQQPLGFRIVGGNLHIDPLIRNMIARQKVAQVIRPRRPARAQHPDSLEGRTVGGLPVIEQVIQLRIQMLGREGPRASEKNN